MPTIRSLFVALSLVIPTAVAAQNGRIGGRVAGTNGVGLGGVQVRVQATALGAISADDGTYLINNVPPGAYTINASRFGYAAAQANVGVSSGAVTSLDMVLSSTQLQRGLVSPGVPATALPADSLKLPVPLAAIIRQRQGEQVPLVPRVGQRFVLTLFPPASLVVEVEGVTRTASGHGAHGRIVDDSERNVAGSVTMVITARGVTANIRQGTKLYLIRPQARGVHLIVEVDQRKMPLIPDGDAGAGAPPSEEQRL